MLHLDKDIALRRRHPHDKAHTFPDRDHIGDPVPVTAIGMITNPRNTARPVHPTVKEFVPLVLRQGLVHASGIVRFGQHVDGQQSRPPNRRWVVLLHQYLLAAEGITLPGQPHPARQIPRHLRADRGRCAVKTLKRNLRRQKPSQVLVQTIPVPMRNAERLCGLIIIARIHLLKSQVIGQFHAWVKCAAGQRFKCSLGQCTGLQFERDVIKGLVICHGVFGRLALIVVHKLTCRPNPQIFVLQLGELEPLQRAAVIVHAIPEHIGNFQPFFDIGVVAQVVGIAEQVENLFPEFGIRGVRIGQLRDIVRIAQIANRHPSLAQVRRLGHPLHQGNAPESRVNILHEGDRQFGQFRPPRLNVHVVNHVIHCRNGRDLGRKVGTHARNPGRLRLKQLAVDFNTGCHGPIAPIIMPGIVVGKAGDGGTTGRVGHTIGRHHHQAARVIRAHLAQPHLCGVGLSAPEHAFKLVSGVRATLIHVHARNFEQSTIDDQVFLTILIRHKILVSFLRWQARGQVAIVERIVKAVPIGLGVRQMNAPCDAVTGHFTNDIVIGIKGIDPEPLNLFLDLLKAVLEVSVGRHWRQARHFGRKKPAFCPTHPANTQSRIDADFGNRGPRRRKPIGVLRIDIGPRRPWGTCDQRGT
mmetsp:Transcript_6888/g.10888  ORF Transcript_6888/g.10888 Transcript_6888/m.10888 type:complete len:639 (+) Transcript_6888:2381-4297(+)